MKYALEAYNRQYNVRSTHIPPPTVAELVPFQTSEVGLSSQATDTVSEHQQALLGQSSPLSALTRLHARLRSSHHRAKPNCNPIKITMSLIQAGLETFKLPSTLQDHLERALHQANVPDLVNGEESDWDRCWLRLQQVVPDLRAAVKVRFTAFSAAGPKKAHTLCFKGLRPEPVSTQCAAATDQRIPLPFELFVCSRIMYMLLSELMIVHRHTRPSHLARRATTSLRTSCCRTVKPHDMTQTAKLFARNGGLIRLNSEVSGRRVEEVIFGLRGVASTEQSRQELSRKGLLFC